MYQPNINKDNFTTNPPGMEIKHLNVLEPILSRFTGS